MPRKQKPILFQTEMVQAILTGRKTQTRRALNPQPHPHGTEVIDSGRPWNKGKGRWHNRLKIQEHPERFEIASLHDCPYGKVGDVLWVRESFYEPLFEGLNGKYYYKADLLNQGWKFKWKPSIHMPKAAARIFLEITDIRVEKLRSITEEDAIAEGILDISDHKSGFWKCYSGDNPSGWWVNPIFFRFESLIQKIHGANLLYKNPWVWVIKFKVLSTNGYPFNPDVITDGDKTLLVDYDDVQPVQKVFPEVGVKLKT